MDVRELVDALVRDDLLAARQWVKDARRAGTCMSDLMAPQGPDAARYAAAAGLVELLAQRAGEEPPEWSVSPRPAPCDVWLDKGLLSVPILRERSEQYAPEPLRRRRLFALPGFLSVA